MTIFIFANARDNLPAVQLPISFIDGYQFESTPKFADELRVRLIDLLAHFLRSSLHIKSKFLIYLYLFLALFLG